MPLRLNDTYPRAVFSLLIFCLLAGFFARGSTPAAATALGQFPALEATDLNHARLNLPRDFAGQLNLVILSFAREQQPDVDTWIPAARQIQSSHSKFRFYEPLIMSRENFLYRWWFNAALRSNTTDKDLRDRILTAYVNKPRFKRSLHIANEKKVVALLVDQKGQVYWRADGPSTDEGTRQLLAAIQANGL
jgi:hypothetical protein